MTSFSQLQKKRIQTRQALQLQSSRKPILQLFQACASQSAQQSLLAASRPGSKPVQSRLKLKDYMRLASIQRKSLKKDKLESSIISNKKGLASPYESIISTTQSIVQSRTTKKKENSEIIREEITQNIQKQIKQLQDLKQYFDRQFKVDLDKNKTHLFLFSSLDKVSQAAKKTEEIGQKIVAFQTKNPQNINRENFFWQSRKQQSRLSSPARMPAQSLTSSVVIDRIART